MAKLARILTRPLVWLLFGGLLALLYGYWHTRLPKRFVLVVHVPEEIVDARNGWPAQHALDAYTLMRKLEDAAQDARVAAVVLDFTALAHIPPALVEELAPTLRRLRVRKPVFAYAERYRQSAYALALEAKEIWLHPMGMVDLSGVALVRPFFAEALSKLGIRAIELRGGRYKAAAESLVRSRMSKAAKEEAARLVQDLAHWLEVRIRKRASRFSWPRYHEALAEHGDWAALARTLGLVDRLGTWQEMLKEVALRASVDVEKGFVALSRYPGLEHAEQGGVIALVRASGVIVREANAPGLLDARMLADTLLHLAHTSEVRAVVLRLDTPGGDALAAETVRTALLRLQRAGKPVVVSMGSVCASGGYWIAAAAQRIVAQPHTLTGSIGVIGVLWDASTALHRLGVRFDGYTSHDWLHMPDQPPSASILRAWRKRLGAIYARFLRIVASGRKLTLSQVRAIAEGHVWTGAEAQQRGLVDRLGGLRTALTEAARIAGLKAWHIKPISLAPSWWQRLQAWMAGTWLAAPFTWHGPSIWAWETAQWVW